MKYGLCIEHHRRGPGKDGLRILLMNEQKLKVGISGVVTEVETMQVAAELCRREVGLP
jgi:hypothetical protein